MLIVSRERSIVKPRLGPYLASIRSDREMSLRDVEDATNKEVSNAYLSQIETGKILQPSPNVLHALAEVYKISYEKLMEMAGHVVPSKEKTGQKKHGRLPTFAEHNLTREEEEILMDYLKFIRRNRSNDKTG